MTITLQELNWVSNLHGTRFKQGMCGVASVSMGFFYMHCHFTTPVQTRRQPKRTIFWEENFRVHMIHHLRHNDKSLFTEKLARRPLDFSPPKRDEWRGSLANAQAQAHTHSHCEGADFRRRRRHRCLRFCILQING